MDNQEVARRVDRALRDMISDLIVANTELKIRVELLTAEDAAQNAEKKDAKPPLKAVKD